MSKTITGSQIGSAIRTHATSRTDFQPGTLGASAVEKSILILGALAPFPFAPLMFKLFPFAPLRFRLLKGKLPPLVARPRFGR
jgi:hypothetical protein